MSRSPLAPSAAYCRTAPTRSTAARRRSRYSKSIGLQFFEPIKAAFDVCIETFLEFESCHALAEAEAEKKICVLLIDDHFVGLIGGFCNHLGWLFSGTFARFS